MKERLLFDDDINMNFLFSIVDTHRTIVFSGNSGKEISLVSLPLCFMERELSFFWQNLSFKMIGRENLQIIIMEDLD